MRPAIAIRRGILYNHRMTEKRILKYILTLGCCAAAACFLLSGCAAKPAVSLPEPEYATPAPTPTPVQPADPQTPSAGTPQTGDASMPALWLALTALSGTGFASVQIARIRARRRGR